MDWLVTLTAAAGAYFLGAAQDDLYQWVKRQVWPPPVEVDPEIGDARATAEIERLEAAGIMVMYVPKRKQQERIDAGWSRVALGHGLLRRPQHFYRSLKFPDGAEHKEWLMRAPHPH